MQTNTRTLRRMAFNFIKANVDLTEILIYDAIADKQSYNWWTDEKGTEVTPKLFRETLNKVTTPNICVRINSCGGDVFAAQAIRTAILDSRQAGKTVTCKIDGFCASAAVGIAAACETIAISSSAYFMIHDPAVFACGYYTASDFGGVIEMLDKIKKGIINAYAQKTGKDKTEISGLMTKETWYTGDEAVEAGFCDELMFESMGAEELVQNTAALSAQLYHNMPAALVNQIGSHIKCKTTKEEVNDMPENKDIKTVNDLKTAYPELTKTIVSEATLLERQRIQAIEEVAVLGFEDLVREAKFETPISAGEVAMKMVAAQKKQGINYLMGRDADVKNGGVGTEGAGAPPEDMDDSEIDAAIDTLFPGAK